MREAFRLRSLTRGIIKRFYGNSINAVKTQVWIAVRVYVLVGDLEKGTSTAAKFTQHFKF
jgi:hypothetical protein